MDSYTTFAVQCQEQKQNIWTFGVQRWSYTQGYTKGYIERAIFLIRIL